MNNNTDTNTDTIIDLDPDQVIENNEKPSKMGTLTGRTYRKRNWLYLGVALIAAALGGGWLYKDVLSAYLPSDQMTALTDKVAILEKSNTALGEQLANIDRLSAQLKSDIDIMEAKDAELAGMAVSTQTAQTATAEKLTALEQALGDTRKAVTDLSSPPVVAADGTAVPVDAAAISVLQQRVDNLEKDVASLKVKPIDETDNRAALSQGLSDLKAKIAAGTGYRDEYERIQRMVPAAAGLDVLQQYASLGLPDAKGLAAELKNLIGSLPKPIVPGPVPESEGWWAGIYNSLSDLITIKVEGDVDWPSAASAAAALADSGDLPQAIEQLTKIEGDKPADVQQWIDRATARLALQSATKSVEDAVLRVIAAKG
jgi:hypothetical protein